MSEQRYFIKNWAIICLANLFVASILGVLMRFKINFPLPSIDQGNLLHAHSHFVFQGWVTLALFCSFVVFIIPKQKQSKISYKIQFWLMEISAWGMLITFVIYGYNKVSIGFSVLSQLVFYWFALDFMLDTRKNNISKVVKGFAVAAIVSGLISTIGTYALGYFSMTGKGSPLVTRGSLYYYLHFQYNGWFSFAVLALFFQWLDQKKIQFPQKSLNLILIFFVIGLIPGYALSLMGYVNQLWVHLLSWFAIVTQLFAVVILFKQTLKNRKLIQAQLYPITQLLWSIAFLSLLVKSILQALSLHPDLAIVAFSLRPLVIGYLHLIFICMVSFFLFGYFIQYFKIQFSTSILAKIGLIVFFIFAILNELFLFLHAFGFYFSFNYPNIPMYLFWITIVMSLSLLFFVLGQLKSRKTL